MIKTLMVAVMLIIASSAVAGNVAKVYNIRPGIKVSIAETKCQMPYMKKAATSKAAVVQNEQGNFIKGCWYEVNYNGKKLIHIDWANPNAEGDFAELEPTLFTDEEVL